MNKIVPHLINALKFAGKVAGATVVAMATTAAVEKTAELVRGKKAAA
jgi:hypothetical protein